MAAGPISVLNGLTLTSAEQVSGYTSNTANGGPDVAGLFNSAIEDLQAAATKLTEINAVLPSGSNKTAIAAQLTALTATS